MAAKVKEQGLGDCPVCGRVALTKFTGGELTGIEGPEALRLKDGSHLCGACVRKLRVMYPLQYTFDETKRSVVKKDPLSELNTEEAVEAAKEVPAYREDLREQYGFHNAVFVVDAMKESKGGFLQAPMVTIFGQVLYGTFFIQDQVTILSEGKEIKVEVEWIDTYDYRIPMDASDVKRYMRERNPATKVGENGYLCRLVVQAKGVSLQKGDLVVKD